jgi:hypothetical protein
MDKHKLNLIISVSSVSIFLALVISSSYFYNKYKKTELLLNNPTLAAKEEVAALTSKISLVMELPKKEEPVLVTVLDTTKLKGQQFFANAKNGDKVLIYSKSNKAILYRPSTNKIIEVAPVQMGQEQAPVKIAVLNGTASASGSASMEKELITKISNITLVKNSKAKALYKKTLVVDVQGTRAEMVKQLAQFVDGEVSVLPKTEVISPEEKKNIDLLVIVGSASNNK